MSSPRRPCCIGRVHIVIVGCGRVGSGLAVDLVEEYDGDESYPDAVIGAAAATDKPMVVLANLGSPVLLTNDMLEGKPRRAGDTTMRFLINTTVGVLGFFDVAKGWGYPDHDADFGMTLANWGVPSGPFLFLPVLGPSDPRDAVGFVDSGSSDRTLDAGLSQPS